MSNDAQRVIAFDYGEKRIGVAVGQSITGTANPLSGLKAKDGQPNWQEVEALLKEKGCPKINLQVRNTNENVIAFYNSIGYGDDNVVGLGKRLESDES